MEVICLANFHTYIISRQNAGNTPQWLLSCILICGGSVGAPKKRGFI